MATSKSKSKSKSSKSVASNSKAKTGAPKPPTNAALELTDPRRKLTKEERAALTDEQRKARREALKARRGPFKQRTAKSLERLVRRLTRVTAQLEGSEAEDSAKALVKALGALRSDVNDLPDDFKPASAGRVAAARFTEGQTVTLRASKAQAYTALLDGEPPEFKVTRIVGKKVLATTKKGAKFVFNQSDLSAG